jgi:hypothetical protein
MIGIGAELPMQLQGNYAGTCPDTMEKLLFGGGRATFSHSLKNNALIISKGYYTSLL